MAGAPPCRQPRYGLCEVFRCSGWHSRAWEQGCLIRQFFRFYARNITRGNQVFLERQRIILQSGRGAEYLLHMVHVYGREGSTLATVEKRSDACASSRAEDGGMPSCSGQLEIILASLEDSRAEEIVSVDIRGRAVFADFMVIASGRSQRHVMAVCDQLLCCLKENGWKNSRVEGMGSGDWVLIDTGDIIIHVFRPEVRAFYNLEKMWLEPVEEASAGRRW